VWSGRAGLAFPLVTNRRTLLLSGGGDFTDPLHPFGETSERIAGILRETGLDVDVSRDVIESLVELESSAPDLVVINAGNAEQPTEGDAEAIAALGTYLAGGGALLAMHVSSTAFPEVAEWESIVGGRWVRGTTMHPDEGPNEVSVIPGHPVTAGVSDFAVFDEMYSWMRTDAANTVLATHSYEGIDHPLAWVREVGGARVTYDALGHTVRSFDAPDHVRLLQNSARWVLRDL
jgi:type 1 glutamine amidotransferase